MGVGCAFLCTVGAEEGVRKEANLSPAAFGEWADGIDSRIFGDFVG